MEGGDLVYLILTKQFDGITYGKTILIDLEYELRDWDADLYDLIRIYDVSGNDELGELGGAAYKKRLTSRVEVMTADRMRYGKIIEKLKNIFGGGTYHYQTGTATSISNPTVDEKGAFVDILTVSDGSIYSEDEYVSYTSSSQIQNGWIFFIDTNDLYVFKYGGEFRLVRIVGETDLSAPLKGMWRKVFDIELDLYTTR